MNGKREKEGIGSERRNKWMNNKNYKEKINTKYKKKRV